MNRLLLLTLLYICASATASAQYPTVDPTATYTTADGEEIEDASDGQNAPLVAHFAANPSDVGDYQARYEWKIYEPGLEDTPLVHRFEEEIDYTFTSSGSFYVQLYATFILGTDTIVYPEEGEADPIQVTISESKLEMPNAFSPNGDGYNDVYKAKEGYQSIVSFKATIINRWGQKLYSWDDPAGGWDGRVNGHTVSDGVYFVIVDAMGADGRHYKIRKDVNVLTGYHNEEGSSSLDE
ncbi:MAG: gliding motility-associated C-terminal domain-containing protein [Prevotellaceae bacterium]|nr:gliding motility-associated C-terminal domain-containing protein [Prevotellaceae bacterium]